MCACCDGEARGREGVALTEMDHKFGREMASSEGMALGSMGSPGLSGHLFRPTPPSPGVAVHEGQIQAGNRVSTGDFPCPMLSSSCVAQADGRFPQPAIRRGALAPSQGASGKPAGSSRHLGVLALAFHRPHHEKARKRLHGAGSRRLTNRSARARMLSTDESMKEGNGPSHRHRRYRPCCL